MQIKEVELNNFRIYEGRNRIDLSPSAEKNIILISGRNGYGKTTFLMSLVWCLYGKQMGQVDELYNREIGGSYSKYIPSSLNRWAKERGEKEFWVSITFMNVEIPSMICNEVIIKRTYDLSRMEENVEVRIDGHANGLIDELTPERQSQGGEEVFIRDFILPIEIAKFFFFDAEKIVSLAEAKSSSQRATLSKAYTEVLGIQKYEDLKERLEKIREECRKQTAKPEDKKSLIDCEREIESHTVEIEGTESKIATLEEERDQKKLESEEIQRKLIREGDKMSQSELEELKAQQQDLEEQQDAALEELREFVDLIPFALAGDTMAEIVEQLDNERKANDLLHTREEVEEKIGKILQEVDRDKRRRNLSMDALTERVYREWLSEYVKKYFIPSQEILSNFTSLHDFSGSERGEFEKLVENIKADLAQKITRIHTRYVGAKSQKENTLRKIREAERFAEDEYIMSLRAKKEALDKALRQTEEQIGALKQIVEEKKKAQKGARQRKSALQRAIDEARTYTEKEHRIAEIINTLQAFIRQFKEKRKRSLEERMLRIMNQLLHKKDFIKRAEVDISFSSNDIDIILLDHHGGIIEKSTLSMGERQMYTSALLHSLVEESGIAFPVFIDSPMQKFDEKHAENIIRYFYPSVSEQVILFPLIHKELTSREYEILSPRVRRTYLIRNRNNDSSTFEETLPEQFIDTHNRLHNAD